MLRRSFLQAACGAAAAISAGTGAEPEVRLGVDTYSVRAFRWKAIELLDYAASLKLTAVQISSLGEFESLEPAYLASTAYCQNQLD